mmetsp:Transcript_506/g.1639  ORF Transcript_506/g.1639 Transcript_506/m.1639 type:complete len:261 (-) Transcript_506:371-1153(-)
MLAPPPVMVSWPSEAPPRSQSPSPAPAPPPEPFSSPLGAHSELPKSLARVSDVVAPPTLPSSPSLPAPPSPPTSAAGANTAAGAAPVATCAATSAAETRGPVKLRCPIWSSRCRASISRPTFKTWSGLSEAMYSLMSISSVSRRFGGFANADSPAADSVKVPRPGTGKSMASDCCPKDRDRRRACGKAFAPEAVAFVSAGGAGGVGGGTDVTPSRGATPAPGATGSGRSPWSLPSSPDTSASPWPRPATRTLSSSGHLHA